jgi:hypothetical protein
MSYATTRPVHDGWTVAPAASPQKIRWGAVFAGTVLGMGLLALLSTLWFALAYGSELAEVRANLEWFVGVSAVACLFVGGLLAGWLSGVRGAGAGSFNGMAIWAMILVLTLVVGVPAIMRVLDVGGVEQLADTAVPIGGVGSELWATFWAMLGGLVALRTQRASAGRHEAGERPSRRGLSRPQGGTS